MRKLIIQEIPNTEYFEFSVKGQWDHRDIEHALGHLCGYVTLKSDSKFNGLSYDEIPIKCHGGLTYSEIAPSGVRYDIGFDCAHGTDIIPRYFKEGTFQFESSTYKDMNFVTKELESIVDQLIILEE